MSQLFKQVLANPGMFASAVSQEGCSDCEAAREETTVASQPVNANGNLVSTQPAADSEKGFTYDEGKGTKNIVQLTGPLSEFYTRALNIYYAKKPAFDADSVPENITQTETENLLSSSMIAQTISKESVQLDDSELRAVVATVQEARLTEKAQDKFAFVNDSILSDIEDSEAQTLVQFTSSANAMRPAVIDLVRTKAEDKNKNVIMVITDETKFFTQGAGITRRWIDLSENSEYNPVYKHQQVNAALESLYGDHVKKIVFGFENLIDYLNEQAA